METNELKNSNFNECGSVLRGWSYTLPSIVEIHRLFEDVLRTMGDRIYRETALIFDGNQTVFAELNQRANHLARILYKKMKYTDIGKHPTIAIFMYPSTNLIITLLAILKVGLAYLPLDIASSKSFLSFILHQTKPLCIIVDNESIASLKSHEILHISIPLYEFEQLTNLSISNTFENLKEDEMIISQRNFSRLACVLYTSNNSGLPKKIQLSHKSIINNLIWFIKTFPLIKEELGCFKTLLTSVDSILEIFGSLLQQNGVLIIHKYMAKNPLLLKQILLKYDVSQLFIQPSFLREVLKDFNASELNNNLRKIRVYICGGELLPVDLLQQFFRYFPIGFTIANRLVLTKFAGSITCQIYRSKYDVNNYINTNISIGEPIFNTDIYLLQNKCDMVPLGEVGEICVSGLNISQEYLNETNSLQNNLDKRVGHEIIYRTGDYGRIINGSLIFEGSRDPKIIIHGQRIYLNEIESVLNNINGVSKAVVVCYKPGQSTQTLIAYYVKNRTTLITDQDVIFQIGNYLPPNMIPCIKNVEDIPLLSNGEVDRQMLLLRYEESLKNILQPTTYSFGNDFIQIVLMAVSVVLGFSKTNPVLSCSNFFEIGGNSLNTIQTIWTLRQHGFEISVSDFVESTTLRDIADKVKFTTPDLKIQLNSHKSDCSKYLILSLKEIDNEEAIEFASTIFVTKGELQKYTYPKSSECNIFLHQFWDVLKNDGYSFGIFKGTDFLGISLNFDINGQYIKAVVPPSIQDTFHFLQTIEKPIHEKLPKERGKILQNFLVGTKGGLTSQENLTIINLMEEENLKISREAGLQAMMTTNTNTLIHQIRHTIFGYNVYQRVQVNQYVDSSGKKPFENAPDELFAYITIKIL